jgi:hypothetical protein
MCTEIFDSSGTLRFIIQRRELQNILMVIMFWFLTSCSVIGGLKRFWGTYVLHLQGRSEPEDGGLRFLQNVPNYLLDHTTS